jgi:hypothetical protein
VLERWAGYGLTVGDPQEAHRQCHLPKTVESVNPGGRVYPCRRHDAQHFRRRRYVDRP